jgi:putative ABC transport system permease protein
VSEARPITRMRTRTLVLRGLSYYWRTNVAVVLGVATAVAVLAGALLVGDSVRGSLRDLVLQRLGRADQVVSSAGFFREGLADALASDLTSGAVCPVIAVEGAVTNQTGGRRVSRVQVYGVDDRFWRFQGVDRTGPGGRDALVSAALAAEIGADAGASVLVRLERPSAIPIESLHGRKDQGGRTIRTTVRAVLTAAEMGEFSLRPQQGAVRAIFLPLTRLQQDLDVQGRVNTLIVQGQERRDGQDRQDGKRVDLGAAVRRHFALEDVGLTVRVVGDAFAVESDAGLLDAVRAKAVDDAAAALGMTARPVLTYLANRMRSGDREIPYSLVTAIDFDTMAPRNGQPQRPPIVLNDWAARDIAAKVGDPLTLEYYAWEEPGRLVTRTADFEIAAIVPIAGAAADRDLAPVYPGISDTASLRDWDPPFPIDLGRVRRVDEDYWDKYRTTPKAFVPLEVGQSLWRSRYGDRTSVRVTSNEGESAAAARDRYAARLRDAIDPAALGVIASDVRTESLAASKGATDFGEYFTYFSMFLVWSALLLAALFFRLSVEQRARELGLLRAVGFSTVRVRRLFLAEGLALALAGAGIGVAAALGYAALMMLGLRTWWTGAVATTSLSLHVTTSSLAAGAVGALVAAMVCIWWTLRGLARVSERGLLAGELKVAQPFRVAPTAVGRPEGLRYERRSSRRVVIAAIVCAALGLASIVASAVGALDRTGGFFGGGSALLVAGLCLAAARFRRTPRTAFARQGWRGLGRLGLRNAADRPGRSVLVVAVIASATFMVISVDAFRRGAPAATDRHSGVGGYALLVDLVLPIASDPNSRDGRESLGLAADEQMTIESFRLLPGDDASCLNLYAPRHPRILGARSSFIDQGRFAFRQSLAADDAERANPWRLLDRDPGDGVVPVIADANSMTYVLHKALGDELTIDVSGRPVRLRFVAALDDSLLQSELVMSESNFVKLFPEQEGFQVLLVDAPADRAGAIADAIEAGAADLGADAMPTAQRLEEFHAVENTYLSTFKTLGGLGLLVGTVGLAAVLLRNVLERRRELALLGAVGFRRRHIFAIILSEQVLLLAWGLAIGAACAIVAVLPAMREHGGQLPAAGAALLVVAVFVAGLLSSAMATRAALRTPLLEALRSE